MTTATAVTFFHPGTDPGGFTDWSAGLLSSAAESAGHLSGRGSVHDGPHLDRAVAVTFCDAPHLHAWLDSFSRADAMRAGQARGFWQSAADLILDGAAVPPGVGVFCHAVSSGSTEAFRAAQGRLATAAQKMPGNLGTALLPPDPSEEWLSIIRFRTAAQLSEWMRSAQRASVLGTLRSTLSRDFSSLSDTTPFGTTVRIEGGRTLMTPNWKSAMLVLLVLYPTVMLLSRFLGPVLDQAGVGPWLALWVSQIVSVAAMQWWLMPAVSRPFRRWLDPVDGAGLRPSGLGAVVIVVLYTLTLTVFATVHELQFWDYAD